MTAISVNYIEDQDGRLDIIEIGTGLAIEIPRGFVGLVYPRSSISKFDLGLANAVGVIDSNYRGEILVRFELPYSAEMGGTIPVVGDRVAQLVIIPYPRVKFVEVEKLSDTNRGQGGFGSTDKQ